MIPSPSTVQSIPGPHLLLTAGLLSQELAHTVSEWAAAHTMPVCPVALDPIDRIGLRMSLPAMILLGEAPDEAIISAALHALKGDGRLQTVPTLMTCSDEQVANWLDAGVDDCLTPGMGSDEVKARLSAALRRSRRDVQVNPSTRLAGADAIALAMTERIHRGDLFAACYADLDHFKEFNDRYGYIVGDDVIRTVAELLVTAVEETAGEHGFVGHIGGDDFIFLVPLELVSAACDRLVQRADEILPQRYSAHDRSAGYFFGKDRRGRLDRVPLMTLSIGVVTNARRRFTSAAQVSELATEMKTFAKTLPGSVWAMDRRSDGESATPPEEKLS